MANDGRFKSLQLTAGADLNTGDGTGAQYKAVAVGGTIAANNNAAFGLIQNKPKSGEDLTVAYEGHMKGVAGAAITAGLNLKVTTSGYLIVVVSGDGSVGKAVTTAASGAAVELIGNFAMARTNFLAL